MDVTALKADIKAWEHEFRAQNGRSATIEDVKALPRVAEKYKLYKKLSKEVEQNKGKVNESQTLVPEPPRTPPPQERRRRVLSDATSAVILPKSRPIVSSSNLETKNPFSPVKKTQSNMAKPSTSINPFLTPIKVKRTPSPDPFLSIQGVPSSPSARQNAAIVKARKRLRGESVSPSPLPREKRRRANGLDPPANDRHSRARSSSPRDNNEEGDSFVDDSPVKAPAGGKAFTPLFKEAMPLSQPTYSKASKLTTRSRAFSRAKTLPNFNTSAVAGTSRKRTLSKVVEHDRQENQDEGCSSTRWVLLPPSPPPRHDDTGRYNPKGKGKARNIAQKKSKKARLYAADEEDDVEDGTTSSDGVEVKIVAWRSGPQSPPTQERDLTLTVDPELQQLRIPAGTMKVSALSASPRLERFEVDLPDEMRRVLALSPHDVGREREEEDLVKGLMQGRRRVGGEVWAPGEIGGESDASEEGITRVAEEDDWEGEGVPWEVAEL